MSLLLRLREQLRSIVMSTYLSVCLSVCLSVSVYLTARIISGTRDLYQNFVDVAYDRGSVLHRRLYNKLRTSGFVDSIMFLFNNGPYSGMNFTMKDRFSLNLLIYRKVGQNSISYCII